MKRLFTKMLYSIVESQLARWMTFTVFFGALPIVTRFAAAGAPTNQNIPPFVLSDFIFFGLMFNAAAMANLSAQKLRPKIFLHYCGITALASAILVSVFVFTLHQQPICRHWLTVIAVLIFSAIMSFFTTNDDTMEYWEKECDFADDLAKLPPELRSAIIEAVCRISDAKKKDDHKLLREAVRHEVQMRKLENKD